MKKRALKVAHNRPNPFFSQSSPDHSPQPRMDFSYYEISEPDICSLICSLDFNQACNINIGWTLASQRNQVTAALVPLPPTSLGLRKNLLVVVSRKETVCCYTPTKWVLFRYNLRQFSGQCWVCISVPVCCVHSVNQPPMLSSSLNSI